MSRDAILGKVRTALGRQPGQPPGPLPEIYLRVPEMDKESRIIRFGEKFEALAGKFHRVKDSAAALQFVIDYLAGRDAVASNSAYLAQAGIAALPNIRTGFRTPEDLKRVCATAAVGISCADFALAETGTLVMMASAEESRLISLLPPAHVAVVPASRLLVNLDEVLTLVPLPAAKTSSMVLITGPSRTADIEQILVRGVHGPGEIHVVLVETE